MGFDLIAVAVVGIVALQLLLITRSLIGPEANHNTRAC